MAKPRKADAAPGSYRCIRGINWPNPDGGEFAAEPGDVRSDLPAAYVREWIEIGAIEPADMSGEPVPAAEEA